MSKAISSAIANIGGALGFIGGQVERADTAWQEYEEGYKRILSKDPSFNLSDLGEDSSIPRDGGWWKRTFSGPKGETIINDRIYDKENIRALGESLSTPVGQFAAASDESILNRWINQVTPGKDIPKTPAGPTVKMPSLEYDSGLDSDKDFDLINENPTARVQREFGEWQNIQDSISAEMEESHEALKDWSSPRPIRPDIGLPEAEFIDQDEIIEDIDFDDMNWEGWQSAPLEEVIVEPFQKPAKDPSPKPVMLDPIKAETVERFKSEPAGIDYEESDPLETIDNKSNLMKNTGQPLMETRASKYKRLNWRPDDTFNESELVEAQKLGWNSSRWN